MPDSRTATSQRAHRNRLTKATEARTVRLLGALGVLALLLFPGGGIAGSGKGRAKSAPVSTAPPAISGSPVVGKTLTATTGSWSGPVSSYAYQWLLCDTAGSSCSAVASATGASYSAVAADVGHTLRVSVTASNRYGSSVATSSPTSAVTSAPVVAAPANTTLPAISGNSVVGQTVSSSTGSWNPTPTSYAYGWRRCDSAGASCASISGATSSTYALTASDQGSTLRVVVTATNSGGSSSATSAQTSVVGSATTSSSYPSSFYSGPAGTNNLLPPNEGYPSSGAWIGEASGNGLTQVQSREQYIGRKFNIYSYYAQNRCDPWPATLSSVAAAGYIPMISWYPTPYYADQIINGQADSCIKAFGNAIASQSARVLIRPYWEFNGGWQPFSKNSDGSRATAAEEKQMWQHTIDVLRTTNAFSKASVVWSVSEGYYNNGDAWNNPTPYPGDKYVDWVASGGYNHDSSSAWCGLHAGWCSFAEALTHGYYAPKYNPRGVERDFRGRKPYLVGETGSAEDPNTAGRKGQWMVDMGNYAKNHMPDLYAIVYFDKTYDGINWSLNTSTSSMNGFKRFANDTYFKVPTLSSTGSAGSPGGSRHQRFFRSPSRTISCEIHVGKRLGTEAYCQTLRPPKNAVVHAGGHVTKCFGSRCLRNPPEHTLTLGYGRKVTLRPFRCTSLRKGMRCTVIRSGHGFLIKRSGIRRF